MKKIISTVFIVLVFLSNAVEARAGTRARTMQNQTVRSPRSSTGSGGYRSPSYRSTSEYKPARPPTYNNNPDERPHNGFSSGTPADTDYELRSAPAKHSDSCQTCTTDNTAPSDASLLNTSQLTREFFLSTLSLNSRVAFTSWDFNFSPAIENKSALFPTYELDLRIFGTEFSYLTTVPLQSGNLYREIPAIEERNLLRNTLMESMSFGAYPLMFMKDPLISNLLSFEYRKTTKSTVIRANQAFDYFPAASNPSLTAQDSDLGTIFYTQKAAGTELAYTIKERDWLFTIGFYALRIGFFDLDYTKPYQMNAELYEGDILVERRVYLFEGQASAQGLMIGLQNLLFPTWETSRFQFSSPERLAAGFFWGLKELGVYWGTGNIRLQNGIDLIEKYRSFYLEENGHEPTVFFSRTVFHSFVGYKFNRYFKLFLEYRYVNYALGLEDSFSDAEFNYFLSHAINRDSIQQIALNLTVGF